MSRVRLRRVVAVFAVGAALLVATGRAVAGGGGLPVLGHQGRWLTDPQGRVVILHGLQVDHWTTAAPVNVVDLSPANVAFMAQMGFNLARVSMTFSGVEPAPGAFDEGYVDQYLAFDRLLAAHGVYDLLSMMQGEFSQAVGGWGFPDWMTVIGRTGNTRTPFPNGYFVNPAVDVAWDSLWTSPSLRRTYVDGLTRIAARFATAPGLLGIEILNEPWPGTEWPTCATPLGCPVADARMTAFDRAVVRGIRSVDRAHLVVYEPNLLFNDGAQTQVGSVDPDAVFAFHNYCIDSVLAGIERLPNGQTVADPLQLCGLEEGVVFANAARRAASSGDALLMDEWGATTDLSVLDRMTANADANMVGWSYWAYEDCCANAGAVVRDGTRPPTAPGNLNAAVLAALVRPYPQAVAGTPTGWSYDPVAHRFRLTYSTSRVGGGSFAAGAVTQVEVPALDYPHGYRVAVTGGRVVSAPGASHLLLASTPGAGSVSVVVSS